MTMMISTKPTGWKKGIYRRPGSRHPGWRNLRLIKAARMTAVPLLQLPAIPASTSCPSVKAPASSTDFYNSFCKITSFKTAGKMKGMFGVKKNYNVGYAIDRSAKFQRLFSDDSRVKYFNIRFTGYGDVTKSGNGETLLRQQIPYFCLLPCSFYPAKEKVIRVKVPDWLELDIRNSTSVIIKSPARKPRKREWPYTHTNSERTSYKKRRQSDWHGVPVSSPGVCSKIIHPTTVPKKRFCRCGRPV